MRLMITSRTKAIPIEMGRPGAPASSIESPALQFLLHMLLYSSLTAPPPTR